MEKAYLVTLKTNLQKILNNKNIDRLYLGDGECEFNFVNLLKNQNYYQIILNSKKKITILTPIMTDKTIIFFKKLLEKDYNIIIKSVSEIIINDLGLLKIIKNLFGTKINIIYGNYLLTQRRDPFLINSKDKLDKIINIDYTIYDDFFKENSIDSIELYNVTQGISITNLNMSINISYPYIIQSTTRYCARNLIQNKINYLKIVDSCSGCEKKEYIKFKQKYFDNTYLYNYGNRFFYPNYNFKNLNKDIVKRIVYNYDLKK